MPNFDNVLFQLKTISFPFYPPDMPFYPSLRSPLFAVITDDFRGGLSILAARSDNYPHDASAASTVMNFEFVTTEVAGFGVRQYVNYCIYLAACCQVKKCGSFTLPATTISLMI
jgi:hypothetical protein